MGSYRQCKKEKKKYCSSKGPHSIKAKCQFHLIRMGLALCYFHIIYDQLNFTLCSLASWFNLVLYSRICTFAFASISLAS